MQSEPMELQTEDKLAHHHGRDPPQRYGNAGGVDTSAAGRASGRPQDSETPASEMARHLLEERASHCCSCDLVVKKGPPGNRGGGRTSTTSTPEMQATEALMNSVPVQQQEDATPPPRGRSTVSGPVGDRDAWSVESRDTTSEEKLPYHVHIVDRCPNGDPIVTFVPEPEANGKGHLLCLPVVVSKCWVLDRYYQAEKPGRCVAKALVSVVTLLLVAIICFLAGYFTVDLPSDKQEVAYERGPVRITVASSLRQPYLPSYSDSNSKKYQEFSRAFTTAIDGVFKKSILQDEYSHCTVDSLRRGSVNVEYTIHLLSPPATRHSKEGAPMDTMATTRDVIIEILREATSSGQLAGLKMDRKSIIVIQVLFGLTEEPSGAPPTAWPLSSAILRIEPGLINQRGCGTRPSDGPRLTRIVGGTDAKPGRWPWLGSMQYWLGDEYGHRCAASLLNPEWAITAAHCVEGGVGDILDHIIFGDHDLEGSSPSRQRVEVERIMVHPGYSTSRHDNDVALLKLSRRVRFDVNVSPVCAETEPYEVQRYKECYIAGWGHTVESGNNSKILQEAQIPLVSKDICFEQFRGKVSETFSIITDNMICAGDDTGGVDSCQSDSGGPLTCRGTDGSWRVVGLTSFGYGCGRKEFSGVYTRVSRYWDYISSTVRGEPKVHCQELTDPTCLGRLPYTKVFPYSQGELAYFMTLLPNSSDSGTVNRSTDLAAPSPASASSLERMETLVCLTVFPSCEETVGPPVVPCREFCRATVDYSFAMLARCEKYPDGVTSDDVFCTQGINSDCGPTDLHPTPTNHSVINSPHLPGSFDERSMGCTWRVSGPPHTAFIFKFTVLELPQTGQGKVITIGAGNNAKNRSSALYKLFGPELPRPLVVKSNQAWISFASMSGLFDDEPRAFRFTVEVHVIDIPDTGLSDDACRIGVDTCNQNEFCYPARWRCDGLRDCSNGEDEANCPSSPRPGPNTTVTSLTV